MADTKPQRLQLGAQLREQRLVREELVEKYQHLCQQVLYSEDALRDLNSHDAHYAAVGDIPIGEHEALVIGQREYLLSLEKDKQKVLEQLRGNAHITVDLRVKRRELR